MYVFERKRNLESSRYSVSLVARGYSQKYGKEYDEIFTQKYVCFQQADIRTPFFNEYLMEDTFYIFGM